MIQFVSINKENYEKVLKLEVEESQSKFVAPNVRSLADCYYYREEGDVFPYAIQDKEEVVGFILLDLDEKEKEFMIWRMLIDKITKAKDTADKRFKKSSQWLKNKKSVRY